MGLYKVGKNLKSIGKTGRWADSLEDALKIQQKMGQGYHVYRLVVENEYVLFKRVD